MSMLYAIPAHFAELKECTSCHGYTGDGYVLKSKNAARIICMECYTGRLDAEYPLTSRYAEILRTDLEELLPQNRKLGFRTGYFIGDKIIKNKTTRYVVKKVVSNIHENKGNVQYFSLGDVLKIRTVAKEINGKVIGIFRTNPGGTVNFNAMDNNLISDIVMDIFYMVIGGTSEIQILARDKEGNDIEVVLQ